jgi:hypothetical protein
MDFIFSKMSIITCIQGGNFFRRLEFVAREVS